ncbi:MAG: type I-G CRISPR-associated protein, Cas3-extension family [Candidatus Entotheonellia bacterium]
MSSIRLTGLVGSHPLGALAAFGLLRVLSELPQFRTPRLSWTLEHDWLAVLHSDLDVAEDQLKAEFLSALVERQRGRAAATFLSWSDDIKVDPQEFERILKEHARTCSLGQREVISFLAAFGSEAIRARSKSNVKPTADVKPTALHMTSGQQKFLKVAREIANSLDPGRPAKRRENADVVRREKERAFTRALFGPWRRQDRMHSLGWDPSTEALYALSPSAPGDEKPFSERAAVWLAFEAMPLFPCFPVENRLKTRSFANRPESFSWPIWRPAITLNTLSSLLTLPELIAPTPDMKALLHRGITAVYRSACERDANGRGTFRYAVLCACELPRAILS